MIFTIGDYVGSATHFVNFSKDAKDLSPMDKNLKAIWLGEWNSKNGSITQQVNLKGHTVEIKLIAEMDESMHTLRFAAKQVTPEAEALVKSLNDRLFRICVGIFAHNNESLKSIQVLPNGNLSYKADIYGKIVSPETAEKEGLKTIGWAEYDVGKISQMKLLFTKIMGYLYKKASSPSPLRSEIFKLVSSATDRLWEKENKV